MARKPDLTVETIAGLMRVDLSVLAPGRVSAITIRDDGVISGGTNIFAGFDLDALWLTRTPADGLADGRVPGALGAFAFDAAHVAFDPGFLTPYGGDFPAELQADAPNGTAPEGGIAFDTVRLSRADAATQSTAGSLSLGEGGRITFTLPEPVSTDGLYLYLAERLANDMPEIDVTLADSPSSGDSGGGNSGPTGDPGSGGAGTDDGSGSSGSGDASGNDDSGSASGGAGDTAPSGGTGGSPGGTGGTGGDTPAQRPAPTRDLTLTGGAGDDVIRLGHGDNADLGGGDDLLRGRAGDDRLDGHLGDDTLSGGSGADVLTGGPGRDRFVGSLNELDGDRIRDLSVFETIHVTDRDTIATELDYAEDTTILALTSPTGDTARITLDGVLPGRIVARPGDDGGVELVYHDTLSLLYVGYFGRAPDPAGYAFWQGQFADAVRGKELGRDAALEQIANAFAPQPETAALYPNLGTQSASAITDFVGNVYGYLFNREPDDAGLRFWTDEVARAFDQGVPPGEVVIDMIYGAYNGAEAPDGVVLGHKSQAAMGYMQIFGGNDTPWTPDADTDSARAAVRDVDGSETSLTTALDGVRALFAGGDGDGVLG